MSAVRLLLQPSARSSAVATWAAGRLQQVLSQGGVRVLDGEARRAGELRIDIGRGGSGGAESFRLGRTAVQAEGVAADVVVRGADDRGMAYGILELADIAATAADPLAALMQVAESSNSPATPVRGVLRTVASDVQDLSWFHDRAFWDEYLTHLATHRINRFHLALGMQYNYSHDPDAQDAYLAFAYPFLVDPEGFDVRPEGVDDEERRRNLETLRHISGEAARRGIHFQLGLWNHAYEYLDSPRERYPIRGLDERTHPAYCRAALRDLLVACPDIDGVTVRVHYEGGVHEPSHEFWSEVMQGVRDSGRQVELDMHSKGMDSRILDAARRTGGDLTISAKFWAEHWGMPYHQTAVREMEYAKPEREGLSGVTRGARRFTRYGYGDFLPEDRDHRFLFRLWPGSQRVLEWGDPAQVASIARTTAQIGGVGMELCEPLTFLGRKTTGHHGGRRIYEDPALQGEGDPWRKYEHTYRVWGRLLYDPQAAPEQAGRGLEALHGRAGAPLGRALAAASRILPIVTTYHSPSASNNFYWPEIYLPMALAGSARSEHYAFDTPEPGTLGAVSPFDPEAFASIDAWVEELLAGEPSGRYGPMDVAGWLEDAAREAEAQLTLARRTACRTEGSTRAPSAEPVDAGVRLERTAVDVAVLARLGRYFAGLTRAGVHHALHLRTRRRGHLQDAVEAYRAAHAAFTQVVELTEGVYVADLAFGDRVSERGSWADRLPAITADLAALEEELEAVAATSGADADDRYARIPDAERPALSLEAPEQFTPGEAVTVRIRVPESLDCRVTLHYRHLNQGEEWVTAPTTACGGVSTGQIPAHCADGTFALQVFATVHEAHGEAWMVPGFADDLTGAPYAVIGPAGRTASAPAHPSDAPAGRGR